MSESKHDFKIQNFLDKEKAIFTMKVVFCLYIKCFIGEMHSVCMGKDCTLYKNISNKNIAWHTENAYQICKIEALQTGNVIYLFCNKIRN